MILSLFRARSFRSCGMAAFLLEGFQGCGWVFFTIVASSVNKASSNKINVFVKLPNTSNGFSTGWMDAATAFETGQVNDNAGSLVGTLTTTTGGTNRSTFGTQAAGNNEYILVKIKADKTWTGNISDITVAWI